MTGCKQANKLFRGKTEHGQTCSVSNYPSIHRKAECTTVVVLFEPVNLSVNSNCCFQDSFSNNFTV